MTATRGRSAGHRRHSGPSTTLSGTTVQGWAADLDMPDTSISVAVYVGGPLGVGTGLGWFTAASPRPDVNQVLRHLRKSRLLVLDRQLPQRDARLHLCDRCRRPESATAPRSLVSRTANESVMGLGYLFASVRGTTPRRALFHALLGYLFHRCYGNSARPRVLQFLTPSLSDAPQFFTYTVIATSSRATSSSISPSP